MHLTTLSNGLRVASRSMPGVETVAVGLYAQIGSRHESERHNGIAHLFEHMVFKGAGGRSARAISEAIEDVGGDLNAATDRDSTSFTAALMAEHLPLGIELISDLVTRPLFDPADLEREKQVVLQELGEARDMPSDLVFEELQDAAFAGQPLGRSILGSEASVLGIQIADLHAWRDDHYRGGSLILVAAGKVDHAQLVDLAQAHLGTLPPDSPAPPAPASFTGGDRVGRAAGDQAHLALGFAAPGAADDLYYAARMFSDAVGGGMSSRLFQQLREDRGLAYTVYAMLMPWREIGMFAVYAATARRHSAAAASLIEEILAGAAASIEPRELDRVRTQAKAGLLMSLESSWGQAHYVAAQLALRGRLVEPKEVVARLEAVTLDEVRAAGERMLAGPRARSTIGFAAMRAA